METHYIPKRWDLEQMRKRVENLKKIINPYRVETKLNFCKALTDNELDALYLTYYQLKEENLKYDRHIFGKVNFVEYKPKIVIEPLNNYSYIIEDYITNYSTNNTFVIDYQN